MFTGIVEHVGTVLAVKASPAGKRLRIDLGPLHTGAVAGASFAVDGACLTVADKGDTWVEFDVVPETLSRTTLGSLRANDPVNLERALLLSGRLDGHFVQGHIDTTATVVRSSKAAGQVQLTCKLDEPGQAIYVVAKGSIAVSGVSLTVVEVEGAAFSVALIPTTLARTTLGARTVGDKVNVETDILAKILVDYLRRNQGRDPAQCGSVTFEQLREAGWL
jgi:riboflavin synthase